MTGQINWSKKYINDPNLSEYIHGLSLMDLFQTDNGDIISTGFNEPDWNVIQIIKTSPDALIQIDCEDIGTSIQIDLFGIIQFVDVLNETTIDNEQLTWSITNISSETNFNDTSNQFDFLSTCLESTHTTTISVVTRYTPNIIHIFLILFCGLF